MSLSRRIFQGLRLGYKRMFRRQEDARMREIVDVLRQVSLFRGFTGGALRELAEVMHRRSYKREEFIYYEEDPGLGLYIVQQGRIRLLVEDDEEGVRDVAQIVEHGFFGALSLLGDFRRYETAQALTETRVLGFFSPDLKSLLKRNPSVGAAVLEALARHLAVQQVALTRRVTADVGKVAALRLLHESDASPA